jgi:ribosomal protein S18 acetylase RimI-like enzyme
MNEQGTPLIAEKNDGLNMVIRPFDPSDEKSVINLWTDCALVVPWNNPHLDIRRKLKVQSEGFLVALAGRQIVATVMAGYDGHRGWINYLAVDPRYRHRGIGRRLMEAAEAYLRALGCPKINLQVRSSNTGVVEFYNRIGFKTDEVVSLGKRLESDEA